MTDIEKLKALAVQAALGLMLAEIIGTFALMWGARFAARARVSFWYAFWLSCILQAVVLIIGFVTGWFFGEHLGIAACIAAPLMVLVQAFIVHRAFRAKNPSSSLVRACVVTLIYFGPIEFLSGAVIAFFFG